MGVVWVNEHQAAFATNFATSQHVTEKGSYYIAEKNNPKNSSDV